jgi:hypothetical protein
MPYILVFEYMYIFRHTSYFNFDGTAKYVKRSRGNAVDSVKQRIFVNEARLSAEKPDQTSFATHMHFIVSDKNNINFKRNTGERTL